jgi:hypothetical protein
LAACGNFSYVAIAYFKSSRLVNSFWKGLNMLSAIAKSAFLSLFLGLAVLVLRAKAQDDQGGNGPPPQNGPPPRNQFDGPGPGRPDPRMMDQLQGQLGMTDDQFQTAIPLIGEIMQLRRAVNGPGPTGGPGGPNGMRRGGFGQRPGRDNGPDFGGPPPQQTGPTTQPAGASLGRDIQEKLDDLRQSLRDKSTNPDEIKIRLDAYRAAKSAASDELAKTRDQLKQNVTPRQEAVLVAMGVLD